MQILNFSALEHNALFFKSLLGNSKLCAVVKNNAYGHGIVHIARYLDNIADCFAVGSVDEARKIDFVKGDIIILIPQNYSDTEVAICRGYVLSLDSFAALDNILNSSVKLGKTARVHIKIDSGMSRLGFKHNELDKLTELLKSMPNVSVEGVYSHFYGENIIDCDKQLSVFLPCAKLIENALNRPLIKHIANSGGALLSDKYHLDMARIGLGLYGYGDIRLAPVKTVTANVIAVKTVDGGDAIGYGAKYVAKENMRIAVLNVGYALGFARSLVDSYIKINGKSCKVVAVCMAMIIVDAHDVDVKVGDKAILLGGGVDVSNNSVSIYELLCNLK